MSDAYYEKIARINLSTGEIKAEALDLALARKFIGGRGLGTKILYDEGVAAVDPLSPDNKLAYITGPMTGSNSPSSGRYMVVTKSPLTGMIACANSGRKQLDVIADVDALKEANKACLKIMTDNPLTGAGLRALGTASLVNVINGIGALPTKNWQESYCPTADQFSGETLAEKYLVKPGACFRCPISNGPSKGMVSRLDVTLPQYYAARGWVNAFPTDETLKKLGLDECVGK